jgi:hypothetical protein
MTTAVENLNNAIVTLGPHTANSSPGVRKAVAELEQKWVDFWHSNERQITPDVLLSPKLTRFVEWYTRAWMLLPPEERAKATSPNDLDTSWQPLAVDTLKQHADSMVQVNKSAGILARDISTGVQAAAKTTGKYLLWGLGGVVAIMLLRKRKGGLF